MGVPYRTRSLLYSHMRRPQPASSARFSMVEANARCSSQPPPDESPTRAS